MYPDKVINQRYVNAELDEKSNRVINYIRVCIEKGCKKTLNNPYIVFM